MKHWNITKKSTKRFTRISTQTVLVGFLSLLGLVGIAGAEEPQLETRVSLLIGFPNEGAEDTSQGVLVVPGMVIPTMLHEVPHTFQQPKAAEQNGELLRVASNLEETFRLKDVTVSYQKFISLMVDEGKDLPSPTSNSPIHLRVKLLGFDARSATYEVQFFEHSAVIADTVVSAVRGQRAVVGGRDGKEAPYLFLILEPSGDGTEPLYVGGDITPPRALERTPPQYTEEGRKDRIEGQVVLQAVIETDGSISQMKVLQGLPRGLTEAAKKALKSWRFEPALKDGEPVRVYYHLTFNFRLDKSKKKE